MIVTTRFVVWSKEGPERFFVRISEQPVKDYLKSLAFSRYGWKAMDKAARVIDPVRYWFHDRRCNNDCGTMIECKTNEEVKMCTFEPLDVISDLVHYDLYSKNLKELHEFELPEEDWDKIKTHD